MKRQRPKREFNIVMWGQFCNHSMIFNKLGWRKATDTQTQTFLNSTRPRGQRRSSFNEYRWNKGHFPHLICSAMMLIYVELENVNENDTKQILPKENLYSAILWFVTAKQSRKLQSCWFIGISCDFFSQLSSFDVNTDKSKGSQVAMNHIDLICHQCGTVVNNF